MRYLSSLDFNEDVAYIVTKGNKNYKIGDIIWIDSRHHTMNNAVAGGWYDNDEINDTIPGMECEFSSDWVVETDSKGTRLHIRKHLEELLNQK